MLPHASHRNVLKHHMPTWSARIHPHAVVRGARPCTGWKVTSKATTVLPAALRTCQHLRTESIASISKVEHLCDFWAWPTYMCCIRKGLCSEDPNPIPEHDWKRGVCCGPMFMWLFVAAAWWTSSRHALQQSNQLVEASPVWMSQAFDPCPLGENEMFLFMGQAIFQHKERIGINSRASTKMLLLKINFRYQFSHLYCLNCLGSMLLFVDAFNNLLILHPTVHVCDIKPSEAATVRHCGTDSQFGCTYFRDSRSTVSLISLVSLTRFKAMPSMSYELVAGPDIGCFRFVAAGAFDALGCKSMSQLRFFFWLVHALPSLLFFIKLFACRFSILALIYLRWISSMV